MTRHRSLSRRLVAGSAVLLVLIAGVAAFEWRRQRPRRLWHGALVAAERGDLRTLVLHRTALANLSGYEAHAHLLAGIIDLRAGKYRDALSEFGKAPPAGELRQPALLYTGQGLYHVGALIQARNCLQTLAEEQPQLPEPHRWLAAIHYDLGAMNDALGELDQLIRLRPDDFSPHHLLGQIFLDQERFPEAILHYRQALKSGPPGDRIAEISLDLTRALVRQRSYAEALSVLESLNPDGTALALRAECLLNLGRGTEALAALDQARLNNPHDRRVLLLDARLALDGHEPAAAIAPLQEALAGDPHDYATRYQLAQSLQRLGRTTEYEVEMARMEASRTLSLRLTELNELAIENPDDPGIRDRLAETCRQLGKTDLAEMWQKAAAALRQSNPRKPKSGIGSRLDVDLPK